MTGVLNVYKPKGMSSAAVVGKVRRILDTRRVGHMGTLDPQGEGVLPIGVGKGTRLFDYYLGKDKVYEADFTFGYRTDTLDGDGAVVESGGRIPAIGELSAALSRLTGVVEQMPPAYSAKNVAGVRAYELARKGIEPQLTAKRIEIYAAELSSYDSPVAKVSIHCSSGTYIRSICRDLAEALHTVATMTAIKRLRAGPFRIEESVSLEALAQRKAEALIPIETALSGCARYDAPEEFYTALSNGVKLSLAAPEGLFVLYCKGELFGLAVNDGEKVTIRTNLRCI